MYSSPLKVMTFTDFNGMKKIFHMENVTNVAAKTLILLARFTHYTTMTKTTLKKCNWSAIMSLMVW